MTPLESWVLFGACIAVGLTVYVVIAGGRRYRRAFENEWQRIRWEQRDGGGIVHFPPGSSAQEVESFIHIFGGVYDHEAREDFHDPIRDHAWCDDCNARLRRAFNRLSDLDLGPRDADMLMTAIRRELDS